ncbi:hypothetical protein [Thioalkalivibrio sp. ALJT]|uniref:hypothetical protein n=1 Tax=Thioalkalivibrio sp. ALJT TaxID=1158146 RepID=UPI00037C5696|nr:hypothetical protein [Thioalkalivibrio sp. ALJT]
MLSGNPLSDLALLRPHPSPSAPASGLPAVGSGYSLNNGNIKGTVAVIDGLRVHHEERVKLFGSSEQLTLTNRQGNRLSLHTQQHHWIDTRA